MKTQPRICFSCLTKNSDDAFWGLDFASVFHPPNQLLIHARHVSSVRFTKSQMLHVSNMRPYIYHQFKPNVGKYSIHGAIWECGHLFFLTHLLIMISTIKIYYLEQCSKPLSHFLYNDSVYKNIIHNI